MLAVEPTGQTANRRGRNGNEAITDVASEAFTGGCTINMSPLIAIGGEHIVLLYNTLSVVCKSHNG